MEVISKKETAMYSCCFRHSTISFMESFVTLVCCGVIIRELRAREQSPAGLSCSCSDRDSALVVDRGGKKARAS